MNIECSHSFFLSLFFPIINEIPCCTFFLQPVLFTLGHVALLGDMALLVNVGRKLLIDGGGLEGGTNPALSENIFYIRWVGGGGGQWFWPYVFDIKVSQKRVEIFSYLISLQPRCWFKGLDQHPWKCASHIMQFKIFQQPHLKNKMKTSEINFNNVIFSLVF